MPNNDLGTAHGRIRIDYDGRGSAAATAALIKMQQQFETMNRNLGRIERGLSNVEVTFRESSRSISKASKETKNFSSDIFKAQKSVSSFTKDTKELINELDKFQRFLFRVDERGRTFLNLSKKMVAFGDNLKEGTNTLTSFNNALKVTGVYTNFFRKNLYRAVNQITGTKKAMERMPTWTRSLYSLAGSLTKVSAAGLLAGKALDAGFIKKFTNTRVFANLVKSLNESGNALERFYARYDTIFNKLTGSRFQKIIPARLFSPLVRQLQGAEDHLKGFVGRSSDKLSFFSRQFNTAFKPIAAFAREMRGFVLGTALVTSGVGAMVESFRWLGRVPKPILMALGIAVSTVLPAAFEVLGKSLTAVSNLFAGLWDGIKQISRGFVVLPGLIGTVTAAFTSLIPVFRGLSDAFKDIFSDDPVEVWEAWFKLPKHLRPMAAALRSFIPQWKKLQVNIQTTAFKGIENQIKTLGEIYFPLFEKGAHKVTVAFRDMKDEIAKFFVQQETQGDISHVYSATAGIIKNLAEATGPALRGLSDMAAVGATFLRDLTSWAPSLSEKFQEWAKVNRNNGNFMDWMQEARSGIYDLVKGIGDLSGGLWTILTIFKSNDGSNFLDNFAVSMEKFNQAMKRSAGVGFLRELGDAVRAMGTEKMAVFMELWDGFTSAFKSIKPAVTALTDAFSSVFIPTLKWAMVEIKFVADALHSLGLDKLTGLVLGFAASWKLIPSLLKPTWEGLKILGGTFLILKNKGKLIKKLELAFVDLGIKMSAIPVIGNKISDVFTSLAGGASRLIAGLTAIAVAVATVLAAIVVFWAAWRNGNEQIKKFETRLESARLVVTKFDKAFNKAFLKDKGEIGKESLGAIQDGLNDMMHDAQKAADDMPGFMQHVWDAINIVPEDWNEPFKLDLFKGDREATNRLQELGTQGELAVAGFKKIEEAGIDLQQVLASNDDAFKTSIDEIRSMGHEGNAAADRIELLRKKIDENRQAAERAGPEAILLSEGFKKIAEAAGDTAQKFDGLKNVLEALGIIKPDKIQAAIDYNNSLRELGDTVDEIAAKGTPVTDLVKDGDFRLDTEAGSKFAQEMLDTAQAFKNALQAEHDLDETWAELQEHLKEISTETTIPIEELNTLINLAGAVRDVGGIPVTSLLDVNDETSSALMALYAETKTRIEGDPIEPTIVTGLGNAQQVADEINKILPGYAGVRDGNNLVIFPVLTPQAEDILGDAIKEISPSLPKLEVDVETRTTSPVEEILNPSPENDASGPILGIPQTPGGGQGYANWGQVSEYLDIQREARDAGVSFVDALADGMESNNRAERAAENIGASILRKFHQSPPKEGPLAQHGDAAIFAGRQFGVSYASGIISGEGTVGEASASLAGSAGGGITGGNIQNDKNYQAGKFLGQLSSIVDFTQNAFEAFTKITDTFLGLAKFASDPLGKGTFFGKRGKFVRDPGFGRRERGDAIQGRTFDFHGSGRRPDTIYDAQGRPIGGSRSSVGSLAPGADRQSIANYIIDKALSLGYSKEQADMFLIQAVGESEGLDPLANGGNQDGTGNVLGIFQFTPPTWKDAGGGNVLNPQENIDNYFNLAAQRGVTPQNLARGEQLGAASVGGPWHPDNQKKGHLDKALEWAQPFLQNYTPGDGQTVLGPIAGIPMRPGNLPAPTKLNVGEDEGLESQALMVASILEARFPGITSIGGQQDRPPGTPQMHTRGRALDVMIGDNLALGDEINQFLQDNFRQFGIQSTIWRNIGQNLVTNEGGGPGTTYDSAGHFDHVHVQFAAGGTLDIGPDGTMNFNVPANSPYARNNFGPPPTPEEFERLANLPPEDLVVRNPDGSYSPAHAGTGVRPGADIPINPATGRLYTPEESAAIYNLPQNRELLDRTRLRPGDENVPGVFQGTQEDLLNAFKQNNPDLAQAIAQAQDFRLPDEQIAPLLDALNQRSQEELDRDTPESRALSRELDSVISNVASDRGLTEGPNPIDQAASIAGAASSVAGSIFATINSVIDSVGSTKNITSTLVRGIENTEDIFRIVDEIQTYIQLAADIAGAVADVSSAIGAITAAVGSASPTGDSGAAAAVEGVAQIAGLIQAGIETVNALIDLGQEAYRIVGSYYGQYLGLLMGGGEGALLGDVKKMLDKQTNELLVWSADSPMDKRSHNLAWQAIEHDARGQLVGNINVYGGPGRDPRDDTRQMMYQIRTSSMSQVTGQ